MFKKIQIQNLNLIISIFFSSQNLGYAWRRHLWQSGESQGAKLVSIQQVYCCQVCLYQDFPIRPIRMYGEDWNLCKTIFREQTKSSILAVEECV